MKELDDYLTSHAASMLALADKHGTPLYVYDGDIIERQYRKLTNAFSSVKLKIKYALKSNSNQSVLKLMKKLGSGLDAVSIEEVQLGLLAGFSPGEILFTPNGVSVDELKAAVEAGVKINIDN